MNGKIIDSQSEVIKPSKEMEVESKLGFKFKTKINVFEMVGTILQKEVVENYQGKYAGKYYINLTVRIQTPKYSHINRLFASPEKAQSQQIINDIMKSKWVDKKYIFKTTRTSRFYSNSFWLVDWEEVEAVKKDKKTKA